MNKKLKKIVAREFLVLLVFLLSMLIPYLFMTGHNYLYYHDVWLIEKSLIGIGTGALVFLYGTRILYALFLSIRWAIRTLKEK